MKMNQRCPVCAQPLDMEPGFYYGTNLVSYTLAILLSVCTFVLWWVFIGFSLQDKTIFHVAISKRFVAGSTSTAIDAAFKNNLVGFFCTIQCQLG
jgi:hypothetical protein